jgi:hypothetical protein
VVHFTAVEHRIEDVTTWIPVVSGGVLAADTPLPYSPGLSAGFKRGTYVEFAQVATVRDRPAAGGSAAITIRSAYPLVRLGTLAADSLLQYSDTGDRKCTFAGGSEVRFNQFPRLIERARWNGTLTIERFEAVGMVAQGTLSATMAAQPVQASPGVTLTLAPGTVADFAGFLTRHLVVSGSPPPAGAPSDLMTLGSGTDLPEHAGALPENSGPDPYATLTESAGARIFFRALPVPRPGDMRPVDGARNYLAANTSDWYRESEKAVGWLARGIPAADVDLPAGVLGVGKVKCAAQHPVTFRHFLHEVTAPPPGSSSTIQKAPPPHALESTSTTVGAHTIDEYVHGYLASAVTGGLATVSMPAKRVPPEEEPAEAGPELAMIPVPPLHTVAFEHDAMLLAPPAAQPAPWWLPVVRALLVPNSVHPVSAHPVAADADGDGYNSGEEMRMGTSDNDPSKPGSSLGFQQSALAALGPFVIYDERDAPNPDGDLPWEHESVITIPVDSGSPNRFLALVVTHRGFPRETRRAANDVLTWTVTRDDESIQRSIRASDLHLQWLSCMARARTLGGARPYWVVPLGPLAENATSATVSVTSTSARGEWEVVAVLTNSGHALSGVGGLAVSGGVALPENQPGIDDRIPPVPFATRPRLPTSSKQSGAGSAFDTDADFSPDVEEQRVGTNPGDAHSAPVILSALELFRGTSRYRPNPHGWRGFTDLTINDGWDVFEKSSHNGTGLLQLGRTYRTRLLPGTTWSTIVFDEPIYLGEPRELADDFVSIWEKQGAPTIGRGLPADLDRSGIGESAWTVYVPDLEHPQTQWTPAFREEYIATSGIRYRLRGPLSDTEQSKTFLRVRWEKTWPSRSDYMDHVQIYGYGWYNESNSETSALGDPVSVTTKTLVIPPGSHYSQPLDIVPKLPVGQFADGLPRMVVERLVSVETQMRPLGSQVVSADDAAAGIELELSSDSDDLLAGDVAWTLLPGSSPDGLLDKATSTLTTDDEPSDISVLSTGRVAGRTYLVGGKLEGVYFGLPEEPIVPEEKQVVTMATQTVEFVVGPGKAAVIDHEIVEIFGHGTETSMMPDGQSTRRIKATIHDEHGNLIARDTPVMWKILEGDGEIVEAEEGANSAGEVTAVFRAGRIGGLTTKVAIQCDAVSKVISFNHSPYTQETFSLSAGELQPAGASFRVNVVAEVVAANGAKVEWQTTRGQIVGTGPVDNGIAGATVTVPVSDLGQLMVITAAVGRTNCLASKVLLESGSPGPENALAFVLTAPQNSNAALSLSFANGQPSGVTVRVASAPNTVVPTPSTVTTDVRGLVIGHLSFPAGEYTYEQLRLVLKDSNGLVVSGNACHLLPYQGVSGSAGSFVNSLSEKALKVGAISAGLHTLVPYVQVPPQAMRAPVAAELTREAMEDARHLMDPVSPTNPAPVGEQPVIADLAPPALGGNIDDQAKHAVTLVSLTAAIHSVCQDAVTLSQQLNSVELKDEAGAKVGTIELGYGMFDLIRLAWPEGAHEVETLYTESKKAFVDGLIDAGSVALVSAAMAAKAFNHWEALELIGKEMGVLPLIKDARAIVETLDEEAFINFVLAIAKFARTFAEDPTATALASIQSADPWLAAKINGWADGEDERKHLIAAFGGLCAQMVQNGAMLVAAASNPSMAFKRAIGSALGTVISASMGSQEAQDELWAMMPGYSWLLMGGEINLLWQVRNYYGAGKKAWDLVVQVVGDVTFFLPLVKGGAAALKMLGQQMEVSLKQGLKKTDDGFVRAIDPPLDDMPSQRLRKEIAECANGLCFPAGTMVLMADGSRKAIQKITPGERVLADDPEDNLPPAIRTVVGVRENWTEHLTRIGLDRDGDGDVDATIQATDCHPFWTEQAGWVRAGELELGDILRNQNGNPIVVEALDQVPRVCRTWNLTVEEWHTYFVEDDGVSVLTHNLQRGPRDYTIYTLEWIDPVTGVKQAYTGRASVFANPKGEVASFQSIMSRRYSGGYEIRVPDPERPGKKITIRTPADTKAIMRVAPFRHDNNMDGVNLMMDSRGKRYKQPGDVIIEGMERIWYRVDADQYGSDNMRNVDKFTETTTRTRAKEAAAWQFIDERGIPCPGLRIQ